MRNGAGVCQAITIAIAVVVVVAIAIAIVNYGGVYVYAFNYLFLGFAAHHAQWRMLRASAGQARPSHYNSI